MLLRADAVELRLGGKAGRLGECVVETAFLEGMLSLLEQLGKTGTPVMVLLDEGIASLFDDATYADQFWPGVHFQPAPDSATSGAYEAASESGEHEPRHLLALDFHGAHAGVPCLQRAETATSSATTLARLRRVAVSPCAATPIAARNAATPPCSKTSLAFPKAP